MLDPAYLAPFIQDAKFFTANSILPAALVLLGGIVGHRVINMVAHLHEASINSAIRRSGAHDTSAQLRRKRGGVQVVSYLIKLILWLGAIFWTLDVIGVKTSSFIPVTAVIIASLGFGGRRLVTDYISGAVTTSEQQLGKGDSVRLYVSGIDGAIDGIVESITLRGIKVRTEDGSIGSFGHSDIVGTINRSPGDWSRVILEIDVPTSANLGTSVEVVNAAAASVWASYRAYFRSVPKVTGVTRQLLEQTTLRVECRVIPGQQDYIKRTMLLRVQNQLQSQSVIGSEVNSHEWGR